MSDKIGDYDVDEMDSFEREASGWIFNEANPVFLSDKKQDTLERIQSNVIDTYRRLIRFPDNCPGCGRTGRDHDMECETPEWEGPDHGILK